MSDHQDSSRESAVQGRILIVDDMVMHLETAKVYLEIAGFEVFSASDTGTAWSLVNQIHPDLVLLDVVLPGENGLDLLSRIRARHPHIEVIIMTAFGSEDVAARALKLGAADYIRKPFKYGSLSSIAEKSLARKREIENREIAVQTLKHAYEELQVSADTILNCMASGVVAVDNHLLIRRINQKAEHFLGVQGHEAIGRPVYEAVPILQATGLLERTVKEGRGVRLSEAELIINGRHEIFTVNTDVLLDQHSNVIGAVAVFDDVTELRQMEKVAKDRERLAIVGQMAAGIAHEIKNPLTAIKGFAQIMSAKSDDPVLSNYLEIMTGEVNRINQVVRNFLQLAKPQEPELVRVSVNELLENMNPIINSQTYSKDIRVEIETDDRIPAGWIDPNQIKQMLLNLIQNAVEAMGKGGVLRIATELVREPDGVWLHISDTGCGIPADKLDQMGVPFFTTKHEGTGLGLSICHSIVDQHNGRIEVQSTVGRGTTFSIFLPLDGANTNRMN